MTDIKHLVSPFKLIPSASGNSRKMQIKQMPRQAPLCNCDSDEDNDFGMAPECAFICTRAHSHTSHNTSKKRGKRAALSNTKTKTKRTKQ